MANIIQIEPPLTIQKVHDKIQEIMDKLNNCECPCPGRCPCLDDPNNKIVAFNNTISCYDGNTFNLTCFIQTLQGWGFEICAGIEVHTGSYEWGGQTHTYQYVGCDELLFSNPDYDDNALRHIAIGCVPKTWKMTEAMYAQLRSCCEAGAGQTPKETGMKESGSITQINSEYACSRTQCCTPTDNHFIYCCDGEVIQYYSETPLTLQQKQDLLDNCVCTDCEKTTITIYCNHRKKEIHINCLEGFEMEYDDNPNTTPYVGFRYYRLIRCNGQLIRVEFFPCNDELNDVPSCPGTIIRYCCDGMIKTWYSVNNMTDSQLITQKNLLMANCTTCDDCTETFRDNGYCADRDLTVNCINTFAKSNFNNNRYLCECHGVTNANSYNCSDPLCPTCPTSTQVVCHNGSHILYHKFDSVPFTDTEIQNNKNLSPIANCETCDIPFTYKLNNCTSPVTVSTDCKSSFVIDYVSQNAKYYCINTGSYPTIQPCTAPTVRPCLEEIKNKILRPKFQLFYDNFSLWNLQNHNNNSSLFFEVFVPLLLWSYNNPKSNSYMVSIFQNNPDALTNTAMTSLINSIKSVENYNTVLSNIYSVVPDIYNITAKGQITASSIQPTTAEAFLQSLNSVCGGQDVLIYLAERWPNALFNSSSNLFNDDVRTASNTWANYGPASNDYAMSLGRRRNSIYIEHYVTPNISGRAMVIKNNNGTLPMIEMMNSVIRVNLGNLAYTESNAVDKINEKLSIYGDVLCDAVFFGDNNQNYCSHTYVGLERNTWYCVGWLEYMYNPTTKDLHFYHSDEWVYGSNPDKKFL